MTNNLLAGAAPAGGGGITNPIFNPTYTQTLMNVDGGSGFLAIFIPPIIGILFVFGALAFFFMFVWGAVTWILSGGDKAHVESAKGRITNALIGVVLLLSSFAIIGLIETFFGVNILTIDIGPLVIQ
jgi:hypothetical protein